MQKSIKNRLSSLALGISILGTSAIATGIAAPSEAQASEFVTFQLAWSGATFRNRVSATGFITFRSDTPLPNPGTLPVPFTVPNLDLDNPVDPNFNSISPITPIITALEITVTGSRTGGNGTFYFL